MSNINAAIKPICWQTQYKSTWQETHMHVILPCFLYSNRWVIMWQCVSGIKHVNQLNPAHSQAWRVRLASFTRTVTVARALLATLRLLPCLFRLKLLLEIDYEFISTNAYDSCLLINPHNQLLTGDTIQLQDLSLTGFPQLLTNQIQWLLQSLVITG